MTGDWQGSDEVWVPLSDEQGRARLAEAADRQEEVLRRMPADHAMYEPTRKLIDRWRRGYRPYEDDDEEGRR